MRILIIKNISTGHVTLYENLTNLSYDNLIQYGANEVVKNSILYPSEFKKNNGNIIKKLIELNKIQELKHENHDVAEIEIE